MKWLTFRDHKWPFEKKFGWSREMDQRLHQISDIDKKRVEIVDYSGSKSFGF